jgi:hypothetical protein
MMAKPLHYLSGIASVGRWSRSGWTTTSPTTRASRSVSLTQWVKSQPLYDRLYALYENSRLSKREIEPFIRKYHIDLAEFEPVRYRSFAEFSTDASVRPCENLATWLTALGTQVRTTETSRCYSRRRGKGLHLMAVCTWSSPRTLILAYSET